MRRKRFKRSDYNEGAVYMCNWLRERKTNRQAQSKYRNKSALICKRRELVHIEELFINGVTNIYGQHVVDDTVSTSTSI